MKGISIRLAAVLALELLIQTGTRAQNPIIRDQFSADPSARVFNDRLYVFASHDLPPVKWTDRGAWFCMEDYHVFSSDDLVNWVDHGVIVSQHNVPWVDTASYSMWAPDCIEKNGNYYFYFPALSGDTARGKGFSIGVALAEKPEGPYIPQPEPLENARGIDPNVFIDQDGQAYLYWAMRKMFVARLHENMLELASEPLEVKGLPQKGLIEGPWVFRRNRMYYMVYPHVENRIERIEYALADNPMGPFRYAGVVMDESPMNCWTNHPSVIDYRGQWYLFYHQNELSPRFDKNRSVCVDSLFFRADGTLRKVIPTLRGVGITAAGQHLEIDRYSMKSATGTSVAFLDTLAPFRGWKTLLEKPDAWIQYNAVDFGTKRTGSILLNVLASRGGTLQVRQDRPDGLLLSEVKIAGRAGWQEVKKSMFVYPEGLHDLVILLKSDNPVEIDWIRIIPGKR